MGAKMANPLTTIARGGAAHSLAPVDPAGSSLARMLRFERRWLVRVFENLLPRGADPRLSLGAADVPMGRFVDDLLASSPLEFTVGLRLCLWMTMLAPLVVLRRFRTFLGLSQDDKMAVVAGTNVGGGEGDGTMGMPFFPNLFLKSGS